MFQVLQGLRVQEQKGTVEEDPKPGNYWYAAVPTGTNQNLNVGDHHDRLRKRYDEFRGHNQTEPKQQTPRREIEQDQRTMKMKRKIWVGS